MYISIFFARVASMITYWNNINLLNELLEEITPSFQALIAIARQN